jgi:sugar O-acyltransferase (sialic acid O-acetyltransferase NeuD family)
MIIVGAGGHAKEILSQMSAVPGTPLYFFDNVTATLPPQIGGVEIIRSEEHARQVIKNDPSFILGTGTPSVRKKLYGLFLQWGAQPVTFRAQNTFVSTLDTVIGEGTNIMHGAFISTSVTVGKGSLINANAHLHHDTILGDFCEIGPGALLLGRAKLGNEVFIGAGAILLPGIEVGDGTVVGAGAVVTKNTKGGQVIKGNPARQGLTTTITIPKT